MATPTMDALVCLDRSKTAVVKRAIPKAREGYVVVKTKAVALNPTDWKHIELWGLPEFDTIVGCDVAGIVVDIGPGVSEKSKVKKGDLVAGMVHGTNPAPNQGHTGCFAEYALIKVGVFAIIPPHISASEAATLGVGISTSGWALFLTIGVTKPWESTDVSVPSESNTLLVYGAASACGLCGVQLAKAAGWKVIAVASPANHDMLRSYGADAVFSYQDPAVDAAAIRKYTKDKLYHAFDAVSIPESAKFCFAALSSSAPPSQKLYYGSVEEVEGIVSNDKIETGDPSCFSLIGEAFLWPDDNHLSEPQPDKYEFSQHLWGFTEHALAEGKIKGLPVDERKGGLAAIPDGLADIRAGKVRGKKVVYPIA